MILRIDINLAVPTVGCRMDNVAMLARRAVTEMNIGHVSADQLFDMCRKGEPEAIEHLLHQMGVPNGEVAVRVTAIDAEMDQRHVNEITSTPFSTEKVAINLVAGRQSGPTEIEA